MSTFACPVAASPVAGGPVATNPVIPTDEQLMQAVADGDADAIRRLYDRYGRLVYSQARKICVSDGLAEDAAQGGHREASR